jgi:colanic acid/amylovoran biosynthesis glycosyltransferase
MLRQINAFRDLNIDIVCWERYNELVLLPNVRAVNVLPFKYRNDIGMSRWLRRFRNLGSRNFFTGTYEELRFLDTLIESTQPQVILCHFGHTALRMLNVAKRRDIPIVAHFHGHDLSESLGNRWYRWSLQRALHQFAAIVVVGSHQRNWLLEQGVPSHRIHLIPCGVPTNDFLPDERKGSSGPLKTVAVSRLVPWKGLEENIRALRLLRAKGVDVEFHIIGDGFQRIYLESLAVELGIQKYVMFHGVKNGKEVKDFLQECHVFVQHSMTDRTGWSEGFGVSIAEASSMELPVVTTANGGIPDQVLEGETGFMVQEGDIEGIAEALERLAKDTQLRVEMGRAARRRMQENFEVVDQASKLERVLVGAAQKSNQSP